ncbi:hypothetical protein Tco_0540031 [Tanacetum coccineum]
MIGSQIRKEIATEITQKPRTSESILHSHIDDVIIGLPSYDVISRGDWLKIRRAHKQNLQEIGTFPPLHRRLQRYRLVQKLIDSLIQASYKSGRRHRILCDLGFTFYYFRRGSSMNRGSLVSYTTSSGNKPLKNLFGLVTVITSESSRSKAILESEKHHYPLRRLGNLPSIHLESEELELDRRELDKQEVEQPEDWFFEREKTGRIPNFD